MNLQESIRKVLKEELNKPSESEFKQALKDVMTLIPLISHRILRDGNMEHNGEKIIKLNKEILQKVIKGDDEILDEMWDRAGSMIMKHAINVITYYTKMNLEENDTSWENDEGDKITLMDLLNATEDIPVERVSVEELKPHLLTWDGDEDEVKKIEGADLQYPILIFVDNDGEFISIIDGHHRGQKAVRHKLKTIKAKLIPINSLPKDMRKVFSHMN